MAKREKRDNGEGTIYFDERREIWNAEIHWTDKTGQKRAKKFSSKTKAKVRKKLLDFKKTIFANDGIGDSSEISFEEFATIWLRDVEKMKLKPTSYARKETTLAHQVFPYIGRYPIDEINHEDIQHLVSILTKNGYSYSTVKKAFDAVSGYLRAYRIRSGKTFNPCEGIILPTAKARQNSDIHFFNKDERALIIKVATSKTSRGTPCYRNGYAIPFLIYTGLRFGEFSALTWSDVDFESRTISINKNAAYVKDEKSGKHKLLSQNSTKTFSGLREVPLSDQAYSALLQLQKIKTSDYVLSSETGTQVSPRNFNTMFRRILIRAGLYDKDRGSGVHMLRHTFASMLFENGCPIKVVSELLGHSDTKITENIYIHLIKKQRVKAIEDLSRFTD